MGGWVVYSFGNRGGRREGEVMSALVVGCREKVKASLGLDGESRKRWNSGRVPRAQGAAKGGKRAVVQCWLQRPG